LNAELLWKSWSIFDLYRSENSIRHLVLELKFNQPKGSCVKQILEKKYVAKARKLLEVQNKVVIDTERAISLNLVISQSQEFLLK
jgi:hypothetical protein